MRIDTTEYQFSHGRKPRGTGRWCFDLFRDHEMTTICTPQPMTYTEARRFAAIEARKIGGIVEIHVAP